jgi:hypothetical protein
MLIDLTDDERKLITAVLERHAHEQREFASALAAGPSADTFLASAREARTLAKKLDEAALAAFRASIDVAELAGPGACGGCGGHAHRVVAGDRAWVECTHGCGWSTKPGRGVAG